MKTTKIFITTALIALATTAFTQMRTETMAYHTASKEITFAKAEIERTEARLAALALHTSQVDLIYAIESGMKLWINPPVEADMENENMEMESWMIEPFYPEEANDELKLETWMSTPFESEELLKIEDWMIAAIWN
jgi:hypothetical protein